MVLSLWGLVLRYEALWRHTCCTPIQVHPRTCSNPWVYGLVCHFLCFQFSVFYGNQTFLPAHLGSLPRPGLFTGPLRRPPLCPQELREWNLVQRTWKETESSCFLFSRKVFPGLFHTSLP